MSEIKMGPVGFGRDGDMVSNIVAQYNEQKVTEVTPFSEDAMTKDEMVAHIIQVHNHSRSINNKAISLYGGTKATKQEMVAWHDAAHAILDGPEDQTVINIWGQVVYVRDDGRGGPGTPLPKIKHTHMASVPLTPEQEGSLRAVRSGKRAEGVLSVTERKVLTQVVDNDFGSLKQEMRAFAADTLTAKKQEINADWDEREKSIPDFATSATEKKRTRDEKARALKEEYMKALKALEEKHQDDHRQIVAKAKERGVTLEAREERYYDEQAQEHRSRTVYYASVEGRKEALAAAESENAQMLNRALMDLEKQRLTAQRQVLLSGVPESAMPILDSIPDAKALMVESAQQSARNQIEAAQNNQS